MSKERFDHLFSLLEERIKKQNTRLRKAVSPRERLVITLRYLATGCSQQTLSYAFRVGRSTISYIIKEVCEAIYDLLAPIYMRPPSTSEEWKLIAEDFENLWNMPHVIGAIDGKHIAIDCPKNSGTQDYNYKGFFSNSLLAIYSEDSNGRIKPGEWRSIVDADARAGLQDIPRVRGSRYAGSAAEMRDALKEYLNSADGCVPWQLQHVQRTGKN
eukprot:Seg7421.1 transcript_id=Seg7421.1/GoldUCD/mRNA.D3Y31 product="Protein ANTAGONIST OF LIKE HETEROCHROMATIN PROTEIN 1" protein_id=Seg7421.1/GoldUCD/D3Y31